MHTKMARAKAKKEAMDADAHKFFPDGGRAAGDFKKIRSLFPNMPSDDAARCCSSANAAASSKAGSPCDGSGVPNDVAPGQIFSLGSLSRLPKATAKAKASTTHQRPLESPPSGVAAPDAISKAVSVAQAKLASKKLSTEELKHRLRSKTRFTLSHQPSASAPPGSSRSMRSGSAVARSAGQATAGDKRAVKRRVKQVSLKRGAAKGSRKCGARPDGTADDAAQDAAGLGSELQVVVTSEPQVAVNVMQHLAATAEELQKHLAATDRALDPLQDGGAIGAVGQPLGGQVVAQEGHHSDDQHVADARTLAKTVDERSRLETKCRSVRLCASSVCMHATMSYWRSSILSKYQYQLVGSCLQTTSHSSKRQRELYLNTPASMARTICIRTSSGPGPDLGQAAEPARGSDEEEIHKEEKMDAQGSDIE